MNYGTQIISNYLQSGNGDSRSKHENSLRISRNNFIKMIKDFQINSIRNREFDKKIDWGKML